MMIELTAEERQDLRSARETQGVSLLALAHKIKDVDPSTLMRRENGDTSKIRESFLRKWRKALGLPYARRNR